MNRAVFTDAICKLNEHCEEPSPVKAMVLLIAAISLMDADSLHARGTLASSDEVQGLMSLAFAKVRVSTGNASRSKGGVQA